MNVVVQVSPRLLYDLMAIIGDFSDYESCAYDFRETSNATFATCRVTRIELGAFFKPGFHLVILNCHDQVILNDVKWSASLSS